jgi:hypothetical protein
MADKTNYKALTIPALVDAWASEATDKGRDSILTEMKVRSRTAATEVWPSAAIAKREEEAGLYPDPDDPQFAARLYEKREFYEARAVAAGVADGTIDPCTSAKAEAVFELTPVQRIVSRFMHPLTPYQGMLLFHGVGVGKTCSAVTIAEQFLETMPNSKVIVLVPQALKENFKRTVFDPSKLQWDDRAGSWATNQCTGTSYLERLDLMENKDLKAVTYKIEEDRRNRYTVTGYQAFANWIDRTLKKSVPMGLTDPAVRLAAENEVLRRLFSDHLIIVDEAHNMRDLTEPSGPVDTSADAAVKGEAAENAGGKALNPFLRRIVLNAEGLRLVLMTATPMYNSAPEIVLLLNYLLLNDTKSEKSTMRASDMFTRDGELKPGAPQRLLEKMARRYVSYMRGENPYTFPLRMRPLDSPKEPASMWPSISATKNPVILTEHDTATLNALPLVFTEPVAGSPVEQQLRGATSRGLGPSGPEGPEATSDVMLDLRMQMANITYPNSMYGTGGFDFYFTRQTVGGGGHKLRTFSPKGFDIDSVFAGEGLRMHAPKIHRVVESIKSARGICFAYSRYIKAGALPLAIALERAGFQRRLADGRLAPLLTGVQVAPPVCAVCGLSNNQHGQESTHPFKPACYVLLTSEEDISPNFAGLVRQATNWPSDPEYGPVGSNVKVILGSQVASEGLDLKCIREMHILDSWYHLNRTDQIIGRAIRYCSHSALRAVETRQGLPLMALNNCLIYMHVALVPEATTPAGVVNPSFETADMYAYRIAIGKAQMVGRVQRLLKKHAWDCNLELEAITFAGLPPRVQQDAQGNDRHSLNDDGTEMDGYSINDQDYTTYCDYEVCKHECAVSIAAEGLHLDSSTFSVTDARRLVLAKQSVVRRLFQDQVMVPETVVQDLFGDLPWEIASEALMELIDGRRFKLRRPDGVEGFLVKKAGYLVFQPAGVTDTDIPITMRYAKAFQMRRHVMDSRMAVFGRAEEAGEALVQRKKKVTTTAAAAPSAPAPSTLAIPSTLAENQENALLAKWGEWLAYVNSGGTMKFPAGLSFTLSIWSWILQRYAGVPEMRTVALRWWFDKVVNYAEQRALLELAADGPVDGIMEGLQATVGSDMYRSKKLVAYRIFNPNTMMIEHWCKQIGSSEPWAPCAPNIAALIDNSLGNKAVAIPAETGTLVGFLVAKKGKMVFKTLDTTKQKKHSSVGAECGNMSNLGEHQPRIRMLHAAGLTDVLAPLMLPDSDASWTGAKDNNMTPTHMKDITHQPLCLYMEILTRLFNTRRLGGRRWFLSSIDAIQSGMKGKK